MSRSIPSFPPAADPEARYDAVVRRGARLQRRHQLRVAAGVGGTAAAVVLVLVLFMGGSDGSQPQEFLGTTTTSTTAASPTELSAQLGTASGDGRRAVVVTVRDPLQPAGPGSQVCVHLQVSTPGGTAGGVAAGSSCWAVGAPDGPPVELAPSDAVVGCAAVAVREPFPTTGTQAVEHTFTFTAPEPVVPVGRYTVEATVVSGVGDGCPPSSEGEEERADKVERQLQLP